MLAEEPFRMLVIDSLIAPFRADYSGRGELAERQQRYRARRSRRDRRQPDA